MDDEQTRIANLECMVETYINSTYSMIDMFLEKNSFENKDSLMEKFKENYGKQLELHKQEDQTDLARFYRVVMEFRPALLTIVKPGQLFDSMCDMMVSMYNVPLQRFQREINEKSPKNKKLAGPVIPGSSSSMNLMYFCTVCKQNLEIPSEIKTKLLNSDEKIPLPQHCEKEMGVKIVKAADKSPEAEEQPLKKISIYPAEVLMQHANSAETKAEYLKLVSVGIDIGSSTSHLVFSRLTLRRERSFFNMSNRFMLVEREIIYEGNIIFTPLLDTTTIDIEAIVVFCKEEYKKASITPDMVDSGAVIVTGETAKKQNAAEIANRLSSESGKFVSATAGPNFESLLGAMGSGIVQITQEKQNTILNVDVGGGTSNIAISSKGDVVSCSCINVGGRLLGIDKDFKIWRIDEPTEWVMKSLGNIYKIGDIIPESEVTKIAHAYAESLIEVMQGPATCPLGKKLMMTDDLDFSVPVNEYSFSGGIAELLYRDEEVTDKNPYDDIGYYLAKEIKSLMKTNNMALAESINKIRATVIGAGSFSLSLSGSTCYVDKEVKLPLNNIPVVPVNLTSQNFRPEIATQEVLRAYSKFDLEEGKDLVALYFDDPIYPKENLLKSFAQALEKALPNSLANNLPIILIFRRDLAKILGIAIRNETTIKTNFICLDELHLSAGDWIDIGDQLHDTQAYPVTIKSLVFNQPTVD
jgi:ethanolamine utilization protein EutA